MREVVLLAATVAWFTSTTACTSHPEGSAKTLAGSELFEACVACHGAQGAGNLTLGAPAIAGLPAWYVEAQLTKFRTGVRGAHPDDLEGLRMRPMARQLRGPEEVSAVARHVATLAATPAPATLTGGDAAAGATAYAVCAACHGPAGKGQESLRAPPLAGQSDWYLLAQLKKFKAGVRGTSPQDTSGATMRPMAMTLADEQAMKNVLAHLSTMSPAAAR